MHVVVAREQDWQGLGLDLLSLFFHFMRVLLLLY